MTSELFASGDDFFKRALHDISQANESITVEMYKFNLYGIGEEIANSLIEKAKQGIKISILVDGIGSKSWGGETVNRMSEAGIKTKIYHPIPWQFHKFKHAVSNLPSMIKFFYLFAKINTRNHRKIICIDNEIVYLGSINISNDHISMKGKKAWADCAVRIQDELAATDVSIAFSRAWAPDLKSIYQGIQQTINYNSALVLNNNLVKRRQNFRFLLKRIRKAKKRAWLVSAYFTPNSTLLRSLIGAAKRGVDVRLVIPKQSDVPFVNLAAKYFYNNMLQADVKILEYVPTMMHSKYMLIDDWAMVGSSNLNHRSIMHDLEVDYRTQDSEFIAALEKLFYDNTSQCQQVTACKISFSILTKILCRIIITFKIVM